MSIESAKFIVQRGAEKFSCRGDELSDKLEDGDLMVVQHNSDDEASKWEVKGPLPWEEYLDPILHLKNPTEALSFYGGKETECYDMDGNLVRTTGDIFPGEELVILCKTDFENMFFGEKANWEFGELTNTSTVVNMKSMFFACDNFNSDLTYLDTSNVESMYQMFEGCKKFDQDISHFDTSKVTTMHRMFYDCNEFNQNINSWDVSNVEDMLSMFANAYLFDQPLDNWDMRKVQTIRGMFNSCNAFNQDISAWDTSNITDMERAIYGAWQYTQDLSEWCVDPTPLNSQFAKGSGIEKNPEKQPQWGTCPRGENS